MVSTTSKKAYRELKNLGDKQRLIYSQIKLMEQQGESPSAQDVADALGWPINRVTGRVKELKDYGYLGVRGTKRSRFGSTANILCITEPKAVRWLYD